MHKITKLTMLSAFGIAVVCGGAIAQSNSPNPIQGTVQGTKEAGSGVVEGTKQTGSGVVDGTKEVGGGIGKAGEAIGQDTAEKGVPGVVTGSAKGAVEITKALFQAPARLPKEQFRVQVLSQKAPLKEPAAS